jgi:hypothetical protein
MRSQRLRYLTLMTVFIAGLTACGGGTQVAGGGIGGTGISQGSITAFGSVWVNGVEFDTSNAAILRNGASVAQSDLAIGMVVTVDGSVNSDGISGTASSVNYSNELQGPISAKPNDNSLIVLGQTVIIDNLTKIMFNGTAVTIADLNTGDTVEVSGFLAANGIRATYIEKKSAGDTVELKGVVSTVNGTIITIGTQDIDVSSVPAYAPTVGDFIEVKASIVTAGTPLQASSIEKKSRGLGSGTHDRAELEGFVTVFTSAADFKVDGQQVQTNAQTIFSGGAATDIVTGIRLEVKGALNNGILVASRISFEDQLTLEGNILSINGNIVMLDTYPGVPIEINDILTEGATSNSHLVGDYIKIRGRKLDPTCTSACALLATELDHIESTGTGGGGSSGGSGGTDTPIESHVNIDTVDAANYRITTVLGTVVDVSVIPSISGQDGAGNDITTIGEFFAAIKPGDLVDLKGTNSNGTVPWTSIELED